MFWISTWKFILAETKGFGHSSKVSFLHIFMTATLERSRTLRVVPKIVTLALASHGTYTVPLSALPSELPPWEKMLLTLFKALLNGHLRKSMFLLPWWPEMFVSSQPDHPSYSLEFISGVSQLFSELAFCLRGGKIGPTEDVQHCIEHGLWRPKRKRLFPAISMRTELKGPHSLGCFVFWCVC